ncbi:ABC transporter ATP-binding protein, partial [Streptomyces albidoflavus]
MAEADVDQGAQGGARTPTVIADDLHIVYRVNGTGAGRGSATAALNRIVRRHHVRATF